MAQIAAQFPQLQQLFGPASLFPLEYGLQQQEQAQQSTALNQQQALQDILFQQQNDPLKLQKASLENQGLEAGLPGLWANSSIAQDKANISRQTLGEQIAGAQSDLKTKVSNNDVAILHNKAEQMSMSQDPNEAAIGAEILKRTKAFMLPEAQERARQERELLRIRATGEEQRKTQRQAIEAGKYTRSGGAGGGVQDVISGLQSGKVGFEKGAAALFAAAQQAYENGNIEEGSRLMDMANQYNQMYIQGRQAGVQAGQEGKVDLGRMGTPVKPAVPVKQFQAPQQGVSPTQIQQDLGAGAQFSSPAVEAAVRAKAGTTPGNDPKQMSLQQLSQMYPGVSPDKLKAAFKKKFGIDVK